MGPRIKSRHARNARPRKPNMTDTSTSRPSETNPFFEPWSGPFGVPPFARIVPEHFPPAFDRAFAEHEAEIDAIAADPAAPSFENTIEQLERSGKPLTRVTHVFYGLAHAHTNDALQAIE